LAECVLVYMEPEDSASVVRWLGHWLPTAAFLVYEQVRKAILLRLFCRLSETKMPRGVKRLL